MRLVEDDKWVDPLASLPHGGQRPIGEFILFLDAVRVLYDQCEPALLG